MNHDTYQKLHDLTNRIVLVHFLQTGEPITFEQLIAEAEKEDSRLHDWLGQNAANGIECRNGSKDGKLTFLFTPTKDALRSEVLRLRK
jgi:hypothetical protein